MPDISMCLVGNCPKARQCIRHVDSGTKPDRYQTMFSPIMDVDEVGKPQGCTYFWPANWGHAPHMAIPTEKLVVKKTPLHT